MPDYIIYKGDTVAVYRLILEQYLETISKADRESLFGLKPGEGATSNCGRGYQAIYSIVNDSLFLNSIIHCGELDNANTIDEKASKMRVMQIFGEGAIHGKLFLDWYTDEFGLPKGELLRWDGVFDVTFEKETLIKVENGIVKNVSEVSNYIDKPNRINRRYSDTLSNILFKELEKIRWKSVGKFDCSERYEVTIGEKGKIRNVSMAHFEEREEINESWTSTEYNYCIRTIRGELKDLKFDILRRNGIPTEEIVYLDIWVEENGKLVNWTN